MFDGFGFLLVERECGELGFGKVDLPEVDAADGAVVHGPVIESSVCHVGSRGPLGRAGYVRGLPGFMFDAYRDVEIVQDMEGLEGGCFSIGLLRRGGLVEEGPHETGRRCHVTGQSQEPCSRPELPQVGISPGLFGHRAGIEVHVVVQVGQLPRESGRVGQHAYGVVVDLGLAVDEFNHDLLAAAVGDPPMHGGGSLQHGHLQVFDRFLYFVHRGVLGKNPANYLQIGYGLAWVRAVECRVLAVAGEIEQPCRKPGFVHAFGDEFLLNYRKAYQSVFCCEFETVDAGWRIGGEFRPSRYNHVLAGQLAAAPFDGSGYNPAAVFSGERDSVSEIPVQAEILWLKMQLNRRMKLAVIRVFMDYCFRPLCVRVKAIPRYQNYKDSESRAQRQSLL